MGIHTTEMSAKVYQGTVLVATSPKWEPVQLTLQWINCTTMFHTNEKERTMAP